MVDNKFNEVLKNIERYYDGIAVNADKDIEARISNCLNYCGIMYRVFSRKKTIESVIEKMKHKGECKYIPQKRKMQDFIGTRITLYFKDDIDICIKQLCNIFDLVDIERDSLDTETFKPQRINCVFSAPTDGLVISKELSEKCLIDDTFEVQIRTVFSEGWHEVEHDLRYKNKGDWEDEEGKRFSRELNGLFAVLEVCDGGIVSVCENLAHDQYKKHKWGSMMRNHFRLRFRSISLSAETIEIYEREEKWKSVFRFDRARLIDAFGYTRLPITFDNAIYLMNEIDICSKDMSLITPEIIRKRCEEYQSRV